MRAIDKLTRWIYDTIVILSWDSKLFREQIEKDFKVLNPGNYKEKTRIFQMEKIKTFCSILFLGVFLSVALTISGYMNLSLKQGQRIPRGGYHANPQTITIMAAAGAEKEEIELMVSQQRYTALEVRELYRSAITEIESAVLGENEDLEHVEHNLNLVEKLEGYPFTIKWECQNYNLINSDGVIQIENLSEEGDLTGITAVFEYDNFYAEYLFYIQIFRPQLLEEEKLREQILTAVEEADQKTRYEPELVLPTEIEGTKLIWREKVPITGLQVFVLMLLAAVVVFVFKDQELHDKLGIREKQMIMDYPEIISKLTVYIGAGMSVRGAWNKIIEDHDLHYKDHHYAYDEMRITSREMESGIAEVACYDRFGKRCKSTVYMKFAMLLVQNLKKGSNNLGSALREECQRAFTERKNETRKRGEEAGTKLLLPMIMMLCIVMVMIMMPAFLNF